MRQTLAIAGLVALGLGLVVAFWLRTERDVTVELLRPPITSADFRDYAARVSQEGDTPPQHMTALRSAIIKRNRAEVIAMPNPTKDVAFLRAAAQLEETAWGFVQERGAAAYLQVGRREALTLVETVDGVLAYCRAESKSLKQVFDMMEPPPIARAYVDQGGAFIRFAERGGFVEDLRLVPERIPMMVALFLQHWLGPLKQRMPQTAALWPIERVWWLRWRVEHQPDAPLERRLAALKELAKVKGYPARLNEGVLLYHAGRFKEAKVLFEQAGGPKGTAYARMAARAR